jgi:Large eukaryotic DNA virus major capsid protein
MLEMFTTQPAKRIGYNRLTGQQNPLEGYGPLNFSGIRSHPMPIFPSGITKNESGQSNQSVAFYALTSSLASRQWGDRVTNPITSSVSLADVTKILTDWATSTTGDYPAKLEYNKQNAPLILPSITTDISSNSIIVYNGPQTPKPIQPALELWHSLKFWFNQDVKLSIPSVSIPFGQRFINIDFAMQQELVFEYANLYVQTITTTTIELYANPNTAISYLPYTQLNGIEPLSIEVCELYINNIFVNPEIHDIYIKRIGFSLIRVFRQQRQVVDQTNSDEKLLSQIKWPIEHIFVGLRPTWNVSPENITQWRDWHRMTLQLQAWDFEIDKANIIPKVAGNFVNQMSSVQRSPMPSTYFIPVPTVDTLSLISHGITIYDSMPDVFFSSYMPFHYGKDTIVTPSDVGALFVNMALFPGTYQPSGHLNVSRARETYLKWTTHYISPTSPAELLAVAIAINFLIISDGSCVLRYST